MLRVVFRALTRLAVTFVIITFVVIAIIYFYPEVVINPKTIQLALHGDTLTWESADLQFENAGFLKKRVSIHLKQPCLKLQQGDVAGCFAVLKVQALIGLQNFRPHLFDLGPMQADEGDFKILIRKSEAPPQPQNQEQGLSWISPLISAIKNTHFHDLRIILNRFLISGPGLAWQGQVDIRKEMGGQSAAVRIRAHATEIQSTQKLRIEGSLQAGATSGLVHDLSLQYENGKQTLRILEQGVLEPDNISATVSGSLRELTKEIPKLDVRNCKVQSRPSSLSLSCPFDAVLNLKRTQIRKVTASLKAEIKTEALIPSFADPAAARLALATHIPNSGLKKLNANWEGLASASSFSGRFDIQFQTDRFKRFAQKLFGARFALPAPFSVLDGKIDLSSSGDLSSKSIKAESLLVVRLKSTTERLDFDLNASSETPFGGTSRLKAEVLLNSVNLELPNLDYLKLPRLTADSRISVKRTTLPVQSSPSLIYDAAIRTGSGEPARLFVKQVAQGIPIVLDLSITSTRALSGTVGVRSFPLQAFRRKATVDFFQLNLKESPDNSEIKGRLIFPSTEYTIDVGIFGTVSRPQIRLSSNPPIPEERIMAVLVFGVPFENLDVDQEASIASTSAALTDGVLGLASLFALGSTPVERIGYDPGSGAASIRMKVGEGASITVQSKAEETDVSLRKRIGSNWVISTDLSSSSGQTTDRSLTVSQGTIVSTFLEWNHRY